MAEDEGYHDLRLLRPIVAGWEGKITLAKRFKNAQFDEDARECMLFFDGAGSKFWERNYAFGGRGFLDKTASIRLPCFRMTVNKAAELVQLFGPSMYQQNPHRTVYLRDRAPIPPEILTSMVQQALSQQAPQVAMLDPMSQQALVDQQLMAFQNQEQMETAQKQLAAGILEEYLNYTPSELNLRSHTRRTIDEAIIKGAGVMWCELYTPPGSSMRMVGSFYDSIDNLYIDPDAEQWEDVKVIYRKCCHPYYEVEREYGRPAGSLKKYCTEESAESQGETVENPNVPVERHNGRTNDLLTYYKVYSKCGIGVLLSGFGQNLKSGNATEADVLRPILESLDDECYLVVVPGCEYPLNLPPELQQQEFVDQIQEDGTILPAQEQMFAAIQEAVRWPIPFWLDGGWPCKVLSFHDKPGQVWPIAHLKPGLGELKFLNWAMSFLAEKVMTASNTVMAVLDAMREQIMQALTESKGGYAVLPIKDNLGKPINDIISFMDPPAFHEALYNVTEKVSQEFDKRTGLTELVYGLSPTQSRSATDVQVRQGNSSVRIDDMRMKVEAFCEDVARNEAIAVRWMLTGADIAPIVGQLRAQLADQLLFNQPLDLVAREFSYRIAPGSTATRNKLLQQQNMQGALQAFLPVFSGLVQVGQVGPLNSLIVEWGKSFDVPVDGMLVQPPMPPAMQPLPGGEPESEGGGQQAV